jgi:hypothetical protein
MSATSTSHNILMVLPSLPVVSLSNFERCRIPVAPTFRVRPCALRHATGTVRAQPELFRPENRVANEVAHPDYPGESDRRA